LWVNSGLNSELVEIPGFYFVEVSDDLKCAANSNTKEITHGPTPVNVISSGTITTYNDLSCTTSSASYQWYVKNGVGVMKKIQGANTSTLRSYYDGDYFVSIQYNNCQLYSNGNTIASLPGGNVLRQGFFENENSIIISAISSTNSLDAFPNPTNGKFQVEYLNSSKATLSIYTTMGRLINQREINDNETGSEYFDLSNEPKGVYYLEIKEGNNTARQKIVLY